MEPAVRAAPRVVGHLDQQSRHPARHGDQQQVLRPVLLRMDRDALGHGTVTALSLGGRSASWNVPNRARPIVMDSSHRAVLGVTAGDGRIAMPLDAVLGFDRESCGSLPTKLHAAIRDAFEEWSEHIAGWLIDAGWRQPAAQAMAQTLLACIEGAMILARVDQDERIVPRVVATLAQLSAAGGSEPA